MSSEVKREPLWTRNFIAVSVINFFAILIFYLLMVTIAEYAVNEYGVSTSVAGLISSIFVIGGLVGRFIAGPFIVKMGTRKIFIIGIVAYSVTTMLYFFSFNLAEMFLIRILHGIAIGIIGTVAGTIIAQIVPESRRGEGISYYSLSNILATAIGPFIGILLTTKFDNYNIIFFFNMVLVICCIVTAMLVKLPKEQIIVPTKSREKKKGFALSNFIEYKALPVSFIALIVGFSISGNMAFLTFYIKEINLETAGSFFFLIYAIVVLISRPITGPLLDRRGPNLLVYPSLILYLIGMYLMSIMTTGIVLIVAACLIGVGYGNFISVTQTLSLKGVKPERMGLATSTYFILYDLGLGVGPYILGFIVPTIGYRNMYLLMVPLIVVSIILYAILVGRKNKNNLAIDLKINKRTY